MRLIAALLVLCVTTGCATSSQRPGTADTGPDGQEEKITGAALTALRTELIEQGNRSLYAGDAEAALMQYMEALRLEEDASLLVQVGGAYRRIGDVKRAVNALRRALVLDGDAVSAWEQLGLIFLNEGKSAEAVDYLSRAIALDPQRWRSHNALGVAADIRREFAIARSHYAAAVAVQDESAMLWTNYGYSHYLSADYAGAAEYFERALSLDAKYQRAWANLALIKARAGDYGEATQLLAKVRAEHVACNDVGYIALLNRNFEQAEQLFRRSAELSPTYYLPAHENLAQLRSVAWAEDELGAATPSLQSDEGLNSTANLLVEEPTAEPASAQQSLKPDAEPELPVTVPEGNTLGSRMSGAELQWSVVGGRS